MRDCLKIAVTGEVDSGKSTLIGRFLYDSGSLPEGAIEDLQDVSQGLGQDLEFAYLLDSLEEERRNQLTIDTTEAFCKTKKGKQFIFIDVPGHKELLKNMLCGSSYADIAILVIDVRKSIEEQTRRHAFILKFLGIEEIILVLNKMDTVSFSEGVFNKAKEDIAGLFVKIGLQPRYFIPTSAKEGEGLLEKSKKMAWHKGPALIEALNLHTIKGSNGDLRFPIQDIYTADNEKIAVGKIISGKTKKGEEVMVLPLNRISKIKRIKIFHKDKSMAEAPLSVGLIMDEMDGLRRGEIICSGRPPQVKKEISAKIFCLRPLNIKENLKFRCVTQETYARIKHIQGVWDSASLEPKPKEGPLEGADILEAVIAAETPVVTESYERLNSLGRFILKDSLDICAVGIIQ